MKPIVPKAALGAGLIVALTVLAGFRPQAPEPEPVYEGVPLSHYLASQTYGDLRKERQATEAIRALGSNAVPHLIRILNLRESRLRAAVRELVSLQRWMRPHTVSVATHHRHALMACQVLGPVSAPAIPALTAFVNDPDLASHAVRALAFAGPQTFPLLTNLLTAGIPEARIEAAGDLRHFPNQPQLVPVLLQALRDPHPTVRARAADTLGVINGPPTLVVPALIQALSDADPELQQCAIRSLGWLGAQAQPALPALLQLQREQPGGPGDPILHQALRDIGCPSPTAPCAPNQVP